MIAEYVWLGGTGKDLRSKTKVLDMKPSCISDVPLWSCDGSSCFFKEAKSTLDRILEVTVLTVETLHMKPACTSRVSCSVWAALHLKLDSWGLTFCSGL